MAGRNVRHIAEGEGECPALVPGSLRVYSMKYCPFAHRSWIALAHKNVKFDVVNVHLLKKPQWFKDLASLGTVPVFQEADGSTITESLFTVEYLDEKYPQPALLPQDPWKKAQEKVWGQKFGQVTPKLVQLCRCKEEEKAQTKEAVSQGLEVFDKELARRGTKFFGGNDIGYLDIAMWPFFERLPIFDMMAGESVLSSKQPNLATWIEAMKQVPAVKAFILPEEELLKFYRTYLAGKPDYDFNLLP